MKEPYTRLEPDIFGSNRSMELELTLSIAISLKRIADKLEIASKPPVAITSKEDYERWVGNREANLKGLNR